MRFVVVSIRRRCLGQAAAIGILAVIGTGCSSDFIRFDSEEYSQSLATNQTNQQANQYPSNVDPVTTSAISRTSVSRPPMPGGYINGVGTVQSPVNPYPGDATSQTTRTTAQPTRLSSAATYNTYNTYNTYQSTPSGNRVRATKPKLLKVKPYRRATTPGNVDPITTSALKPARPPVIKTVAPVRVKKTKPVVSASPSGWTGVGGTKITLRDGETLYNISKRYGVPVRELKRVNKITNSDQVVAGQRIIIPTYVYSANAPVSAPDNNPLTRASRATTGMIGEVSPSNIVVPTPSPYSAASNRYKPGLAPMSAARIRANNNASTSGAHYTVVSGDSLGAIAGRHKVSLADLKRANALTGSNIRVGQKLIIPGRAAHKPAQAQQSVGLAPVRVDTKTTATTPKPYVKPRATDQIVTGTIDDAAPARTGIETFRWPATGRVMSKFGERRRGIRNDGIDISVPEGTSVKAAENGVVIYSDSELQEYGKLLLIRHADGWVSAYAHNKTLKVKRGEKVRRGQIIAKSGRTGNANRPMIHFELRKDSNPVNPQKYLR